MSERHFDHRRNESLVNQSPIETDCRTVQAALDAAEPVVLLDCREREEDALVRMPGARLIPMSEWAQRVDELESLRGSRIVVVCHHGMRSLQVAGWLRQHGFPDTCSLRGGIDRWAAEIDPTLAWY